MRSSDWRSDVCSSDLRTVVSERMSVGYSRALMLLFGSLMGFINSSQQIFFDVFGLPQMFPLIFAALVSMMAVTSLLNARFVEEEIGRASCRERVCQYV